MKKIALSLIALCILFGQNVSAQTADQRPQTIKPAYEIIAVPDQDLNNTNKPILYRYKITAPKSGPLTISGETIEIQAVGVVPETINLKVFSDKDFKKEIDKKSLKFNVNLGKQKLNFAFKDPIKVKAGDTVYVQIDTAIKGNKDTAYITTKPLGLSEVTVKAKPVIVVKQIKVEYVLGIKSDKKNILEAGQSARIYGNFPFKDPYKIRLVGKGGYDEYVNANQDFDGVLQFVVPKNLIAGSHDYDLYVIKDKVVSSRLLISGIGLNEETLAPKISYVQAKAANKNEIFSEEEPSLYGQNITKQTQVYILLNGNKKYFDGGILFPGGVSFITPKRGTIPNGTYQLFAENGSSVSNGIKITYKNQIESIPSIQLLSPNGGEEIVQGKINSVPITWSAQNVSGVFAFLVPADSPGNGLGSLGVIGYVSSEYSTMWWDGKTVLTDLNDGKEINVPPGKYKIYVVGNVVGESGKTVNDMSDSSFIITNSSTNLCSFTRDLTVGSQGDDVANLQYFLQQRGFLGTTDSDKGYFGSTTKAALAEYQFSVGIAPGNGYFGPLTREKFVIDCNNTPSFYSITTSKKGTGSGAIKVITSTGLRDVKQTETVFSGSSIKLKAVAGPDSVFTGWEGACSGRFEYCVINKDSYKDVSASFTLPVPQYIKILSPNGGEILDAGKYSKITWDASSNINSISLYYVFRGGVPGVNELIAADIPNTGSYNWYVNAKTSAEPIKIYILGNQYGFPFVSDYSDDFISINRNTNGTILKTASTTISSGNIEIFSNPDLELGIAHPDVIKLQKFLNDNGYTVESVVGEIGSKGNEGNYFGKKTQQALIKFQKDKGITPAQGYFGPKTRAVMGI